METQGEWMQEDQDQARANQAAEEEKTITQISAEEKRNRLLRWMLFLVAIVGFIVINYGLFRPKPKPVFDALNSLAHEAILYEEKAGTEDSPIHYPSHNLLELMKFLGENPALGFVPEILDLSQGGWQPEGASVIDYEVSKIAVVQFYHPPQQTHLFQFVFPGKLSDLPKAEAGTAGSLTYQGYGSKEMHLVAWEVHDHLSFLVGRVSVAELAEIASHGVLPH